MPIQVPTRLVTERLVLRRHILADLDPFAAFLADAADTRYMAFTAEQRTREGAQQMLEFVIASYSSEAPIFSLTIADPASDAYLGSCGAQPLAEDGSEFEIYYTLMPEHRNQGFATEATQAVAGFLFESTDAERLVAFVIPENLPSVRVARKLGFDDDGPIERQAVTSTLSHQTMQGRRYVLRREAHRRG